MPWNIKVYLFLKLQAVQRCSGFEWRIIHLSLGKKVINQGQEPILHKKKTKKLCSQNLPCTMRLSPEPGKKCSLLPVLDLCTLKLKKSHAVCVLCFLQNLQSEVICSQGKLGFPAKIQVLRICKVQSLFNYFWFMMFFILKKYWNILFGKG